MGFEVPAEAETAACPDGCLARCRCRGRARIARPAILRTGCHSVVAWLRWRASAPPARAGVRAVRRVIAASCCAASPGRGLRFVAVAGLVAHVSTSGGWVSGLSVNRGRDATAASGPVIYRHIFTARLFWHSIVGWTGRPGRRGSMEYFRDKVAARDQCRLRHGSAPWRSNWRGAAVIWRSATSMRRACRQPPPVRVRMA